MSYFCEFPSDYLDLCPIIDGKYKVLFKLGSGRFSKVKMGLDMQRHQKVAIKIMNEEIIDGKVKDSLALESLLNEIKLCLLGKHKSVIQILDFNIGGIYRTVDGQIKHVLYYVMKIAHNGELFRLIQNEMLSEKCARVVFKQIALGVRNLHNNGISHCDVKSENILFDSHLNIKIADFGYSRKFSTGDSQKIMYKASQPVGTLKCCAPQIINDAQGSYHGDEIDIFACGCVLFQMVMKASPFKNSNFKDEYYERFNKQKSEFWDIFKSHYIPSPSFKDLVEKMLNPNPKERPTITEVLNHPWLSEPCLSRIEYQKDLTSKFKKIMGKVRKEQQNQIKKFFKTERSKCEFLQVQEIEMRRELEDKIFQLRELLDCKKREISDSGSSTDQRELMQERKHQY